MTDPSPGRPLVTFALFAYNQEQYIREAVEGAFSQTYEPLEIILSDDCSSDRTYEIMLEMAEAYKGRHKVKVRRNEENYGLIDHINVLLSSIKSEIIVLAAGDDISHPERAITIKKRFEEQPTCQLIHSAVLEIDKSGRTLGERSPLIQEEPYQLEELAKSSSIYIGATGAIRMSLINYFGPISEKKTYEDLIFGFRAALLNGISYLDVPLVCYRKNVGISSQYNRKAGLKKELRMALHSCRLATLRQRKSDTLQVKENNLNQVLLILDTEIQLVEFRMLYHDSFWNFLKCFSRRGFFVWAKAFSSETKYVLGLIN